MRAVYGLYLGDDRTTAYGRRFIRTEIGMEVEIVEKDRYRMTNDDHHTQSHTSLGGNLFFPLPFGAGFAITNRWHHSHQSMNMINFGLPLCRLSQQKRSAFDSKIEPASVISYLHSFIHKLIEEKKEKAKNERANVLRSIWRNGNKNEIFTPYAAVCHQMIDS